LVAVVVSTLIPTLGSGVAAVVCGLLFGALVAYEGYRFVTRE
jgi:hypothetical protein